jgi:hypothetical protein
VRRFQIAVDVAEEKKRRMRAANPFSNYYRTNFRTWTHPAATSGQEPLPEREVASRHKLPRIFSKLIP